MTPLGESILKALAPTMGMTARDLAKKLGLRQGSVVNGLIHHRLLGNVAQVDGLWRLTKAGLTLTDGMTFTMDETAN